LWQYRLSLQLLSLFTHSSCLFFLLPRRPPSSTLFPYTTLFRSRPQKAPSTAPKRPPGERSLPAEGAEAQASHLPTGSDRSPGGRDRKSTRLNSSHDQISYAVFCLKKKKKNKKTISRQLTRTSPT